jgi:CheY-like chemotaxis protein
METSHILVADDDPDTRELMELILRGAGFRVTSTGDPYEVLKLLATDRIDALLLDKWMPKLNGIELCRLIRSINEHVVIVVCSGAVAESDKQAVYAAGAQAFIGKPFLPQELTATLSSALNPHRN